MEAFRARQFAKAKAEPNTFIGGIAKTGGTGVNEPIDTPWKLSQKLGVAVNRISGFKVVGDDVECRIRGSYSLPSGVFGGSSVALANQNITSYIDEENLCTSGAGSNFRNCQELTSVKFKAWTAFYNYQFTNCVKLADVDVVWDNITSFNAIECFKNTNISGVMILNASVLNGYQFFYNTKLTEFDAPNLVTGGTFTVAGITTLEEAYVPLLTNGISFFQGNINLEKITLGAMTNVPNSFAQGCTTLNEIIGMDSFLTIGNSSFTGNKIPEFIANNVTSCGNTAFQSATMNLIEMKKCKSLGSLSNENIFNLVNSGFTIRVNIDLRTIDGGDAHLSLINAKNLKSATVEFYDDAGNYVSTL